MDSALALIINIDRGKSLTIDEGLYRLRNSNIVAQLTKELIDKPLFYTWRLICLSEIPFANQLPYTQELIYRVYDKLATSFGFSLSGDQKQFLPCYNAMLVSAMCRLGEGNNEYVKNAVDWIYTYQPVERGKKVSFQNTNFDRYGGCFKNTPCYIGLVKSVFALFEYEHFHGKTKFSDKLENGVNYMLKHGLVNRLNHAQPITSHILDISFPETYHLNIVELIRFAERAGIISDPRVLPAIAYLQSKRRKDDGWKVDYRYKADGYLAFDSGRGKSEWVSYIVSKALGDQ